MPCEKGKECLAPCHQLLHLCSSEERANQSPPTVGKACLWLRNCPKHTCRDLDTREVPIGPGPAKKNSPQAWWCDPAARAEKGPGAGMYLMMVCMPRTCGVLSRTLSVFGRGCPWWAEARAALQRGRAQSCAARRATAPGPWRDTTPPKEGSRRTLEGQQRAWPSRLDPEECPMHEISELDYPKRLSEPPGPTHCCCSLCTALASIRPRSSAGQDIPRHPGTWLCTTGGTQAVLLKRDMNCQEQGPCRALLPHK